MGNSDHDTTYLYTATRFGFVPTENPNEVEGDVEGFGSHFSPWSATDVVPSSVSVRPSNLPPARHRSFRITAEPSSRDTADRPNTRGVYVASSRPTPSFHYHSFISLPLSTFHDQRVFPFVHRTCHPPATTRSISHPDDC